ncbi:MAG: hypothetical protein ACRCUT_09735 [Spirochaetota bacterium]
MIRSYSAAAMCIAFCAVILSPVSLFAKDPDFNYIDIEKVSRYNEDRLVYMQVEKFTDAGKDDSRATLLIIKKGMMYLLQDGYDDLKDVENSRQNLLLVNQDFKDEDLWVNKINGKPDYVRVTDRRVELMKNLNEDYVSKNFGERYVKVRDAFIQRHIEIFTQLMRNRKESALTLVREPLPKPAYIGAPNDAAMKYFVSVTAKSNDGRVYYAEDSDGDGITETFSVSIPDNFNWGYKTGPNVIFIYKNKQKDIETAIGKLTYNAYFGTPEEEKRIIETFPKDSDIIDELVTKTIRDEPK